VRDVALASGFQNISYFSRQFKQSTGMTPQEYRKGGLRP
ncbi:MAG TPA: AraC family transcriptional regulator, partial [Candidatus Caccousia stercoris]|nr:AraC family transcriptional regulator [Candidatus Caccousia stercoris]